MTNQTYWTFWLGLWLGGTMKLQRNLRVMSWLYGLGLRPAWVAVNELG